MGMGFPFGWWVAIVIQVLIFVLMLLLRDKVTRGEE
jgi:hypothetical protein